MIPIGIKSAQNDELPLGDPHDEGVPFPIMDDDPTDIPASDDLEGAVAAVESQGRTRNAGFVQVSKMYIDEMNHLALHDRSAYRILWTLVKLMNRQNAVMISQDSLCQLTKFSRPTVKRAVALLRSQQWMDVLKMGTANVYRVNSSVIWQDKAEGRWASFNARIILNFAEQDQLTQDMPSVKTRHIPFVEADDMTGSHDEMMDGGRQ